MAIIAPWREWDIKSRDEEIDYAEAHHIPLKINRETNYSKDKNLWHLSHEGLDLEDPGNEPQYDKPGFLELGVSPKTAPDKSEFVELAFEKGVPVSLNGEKMKPAVLIAKLNEIGGRNGIGLYDVVENRLVGMKSRGVYETPGGTILYKAHEVLETLTLDKLTAHKKRELAITFGELVYDGQWFSPLRKALSAFVTSTQENVTGKVRLELYKGNMINAGVWSPYSLYREDIATFAAGGDYKQSDATGFISIYGLPTKVQAIVNNEKEVMLTAVTGINWGDEGKGRVIDLLAEHADVVARYQGGNNAGHTVVTEQGKFILNLLPSGILHPDVVCVLGAGMVIDLDHLAGEMDAIEERGVKVGSENLKLSDKATISMPWHKVQDGLEEDRLAQKGAAFGSTRRGIAYAYSDKYRKKTLRLGDLLHLDEKRVQDRLHMILESKNLELGGCYHQEPMSYDALLEWCRMQAGQFAPYICDVGAFLKQAHDSGKRIVLEAQLGAMRDIDYGIFPFTSSSNTLAAYAPLGAGIPNCRLDHVVGVLKAYSTCVGAGPFAAENAMSEDWNEQLRKAGGEYGAATGRPRRVGPFDCVASRYGLTCQGADKIALTKLDVLSSMKEIPVITGYTLDGVQVPSFDPLSDLDRVEPVVTMLPGWNKDISGCKSWDELPKEAKAYVEFLEKQLGHEIQFVSTGAEREKFVLKGEWL